MALVNNMPDSAFRETERQFVELLDEASDDVVVSLQLYALPGIERSPEVTEETAECYHPLSHLYDRGVDGVIVTGTEPRKARLTDEPYYEQLIELLRWATSNSASVIASCLAAHAAALAFEGIERTGLSTKCSGVFAHKLGQSHPLTAGLRAPVFVPHSRLNDIPLGALLERGYSSLLRSEAVSWTLLTRERQGCLVVLVQGHPEYSASSLLREYRRDLLRFARGDTDMPPPIPCGYLDTESRLAVEVFSSSLHSAHDKSRLVAQFPFDQVSRGLVNTWREPGLALYSSWLRFVLARKEEMLLGRPR